MEKSSLLKSLVVILLSGVLVLNLSSIVLADDNTNSSYSGWENATTSNTNDLNTNSNSNSFSNTGTNSNSNYNTLGTTDTNSNTNSNSNYNSYNTLNTNSNSNSNSNNASNENNNVDTLAYTGAADTSILAIIAVLGVIVAAYSFKKIREYNSL